MAIDSSMGNILLDVTVVIYNFMWLRLAGGLAQARMQRGGYGGCNPPP